MFELYFGAFDIVLYAAAFMTAIYVEAGLHYREQPQQLMPAVISASPCPFLTPAV